MHRIGYFLTDEFQVMAIGTQSVFEFANVVARERVYAVTNYSLSGGDVHASLGISVKTEPIHKSTDADTWMISGIVDPTQRSSTAAELDFVRAASKRSRRTAGLCTGAFVLADAGLLDGKRATTHWAMLDRFRELFPTVDLDPDAIFVQQQNLWTSAGVTTGIDLALAMVEADYGHEVALNSAKELAVYMKRPGGQPQLSEILISQSRQVPVFESLHLWIVQNLAREELSVEQLAEYVGMSPRNFARVYKEKTGRTPAKGVEHFRLEAARRQLQDPGRPIDVIARECGFGS